MNSKLRRLCRVYTEEAIAEIVEILRTDKHAAYRLKAAEILLAYGWGRPVQGIELPEGTGVQVSIYLPDNRREAQQLETVESEAIEVKS